MIAACCVLVLIGVGMMAEAARRGGADAALRRQREAAFQELTWEMRAANDRREREYAEMQRIAREQDDLLRKAAEAYRSGPIPRAPRFTQNPLRPETSGFPTANDVGKQEARDLPRPAFDDVDLHSILRRPE